MTSPPKPGRRAVARISDPRILLGLAITALTLWLSLRDVSFRDLLRDIGRADLIILFLPSVPAYVLSVYVRALRWRHLVEGVTPIARGPLFRATAVGFMANNIFPLRIGEVVRAWYLAREVSASGTALFGTVIVERLIDALCVLLMAVFVLGTLGARARGVEPAAVLTPLALLVLGPILFVATLRVAPERAIGFAMRAGRPVLSERLAGRFERMLRQLATGLGGLHGVRAGVWVAFHSVLLWLVCSVIPFAAALVSLGIDLGGPAATLRASLAILVWVGAAVALPSAPGFFGPYHAACWIALQPLGVEKELALALGTLAHAVFWISMTGLGLAVLRVRGAPLEQSLEETLASVEAPGGSPTP